MLLDQWICTGESDPLTERETMRPQRRLFRNAAASGMLVTTALVVAPAHATAQDRPTFARDVAPIIQQNCQICHQPGSIAPMSLTSYEAVKRYAPRIREKVAARIMPPWHIDRSVGIQEFKNDRGLTDDELETLVTWLDGDMPFGDEADMPPPPVFPDGSEWQFADQFGEPDLVIRSEPYTLPAQTQDKWFRPETPTGLTEERWVKAIEIRPSWPDGRRIVHHTLAYLVQDEDPDAMTAETAALSTSSRAMGGPGLFMEWAVGKVGEIFPDGAGKLMLPGSRIRWEVHMHAIGQEVKDSYVELGIWFYPRDQIPQNRTRLAFYNATGDDLDIPPGQIAVTQDFHVVKWPARLENYQPHMHMRGKAMAMEAIYPDGRREILSQVNNFQWQWHINYIYADHAAPLLPAGTTLVFTAWHDNTPENPNNPDHTQWVGWGDRTVDEMAHAWVDVTYLTEEQYEAEVAKREAMADENETREGINR